MAKVLGVGGVFFRSADPKATRAWYVRVLGLHLKGWGGALFPPLSRGKTVWSLFPTTTDYFAPSSSEVMLNFVVDDLPGMLERAKAEGVSPIGGTEDDNGRFAWVMDPDGRKIELWEPVEPAG